MLALGVSLLVSVAAAPPPAHADLPGHEQAAREQLASTYDEASCDPSEGGECADEVLIDLMPAPPAILDCQSPFIAEMIGSCDLPAPSLPSLHLPTLQRGGNVVAVARVGSSERVVTISAPSSLEVALPLARFTLSPTLHASPLAALASTLTQDAPRPRLDRPPRA
jgi:hypothetical protein